MKWGVWGELQSSAVYCRITVVVPWKGTDTIVWNKVRGRDLGILLSIYQNY